MSTGVSPTVFPEKRGTEGEGEKEPDEREIIINALGTSDPSPTIMCKIGNVEVKAVVDTGANCTVISPVLFEKMKPKPPLVAERKLQSAAKNQTFDAKKVGPISVTLGTESMTTNVWVAPIHDEVLLGVDILKTLRAKVDLGTGTLEVGGETLILGVKRVWDPGKEESILVTHKKLTIPPNCGMRIPIKVKDTIQNAILEPDLTLPVLVSRTLLQDTDTPLVDLINCGDQPVRLDKGQKIGTIIPIEKSDILDLHDEKIRKVAQEGNEISELSETRAGTPDTQKEPDKQEDETELPERLKKMWEEAKENLSEQESDQLAEMLIKYQSIFAKHEFDLGNFTAVKHTINTGDATPIKQALRRNSVHSTEENDKHLEDMLKHNIIEPSNAEWAASPVLVRKKSGGIRWCVDYRQLNKVTKKDVYPLPLMSECIDSLDQNVWYSKLDSLSAYWQLFVEEEDGSRDKTSFRCRKGLFRFRRLPFGLCGSGASYSRALALVLKGLHWKSILCFLDDIVCMGRTKQEHMDNLEEVFKRFKEHDLKLKPQKCELFKQEVEFLGRKVGINGVTLADHSVETIKKWKKPVNLRDLEAWLGLCNFHRAHMKDFAEVAEPLNRLVRGKFFFWGEEQQNAFEEMKTQLTSPTVLAIPNLNGSFILDTDASNASIGAELLQVQDGVERVVAYGSFTMTPQQRKYCTTRRELLSVVRFTNHFRHYLMGKEFTLRTDHHSLIWLMNFKQLDGQLARWMEELSNYSMQIVHRPGKLHTNADSLSRRPSDEPFCPYYRPRSKLEDLPCKGCKYCEKTERNWGKFDLEVDYIDNVAEARVRRLKETTREREKRRLTRRKRKEDKKMAKSEHLRTGIDVVTEKAEYVRFVDADRERCKKEQEEDQEMGILYRWLEHKETPKEEDTKLAHPTTKFYWMNRDLFKIEEGLVYRTSNDGQAQLVIPKSMQREVLEANHDLPSAAHSGTTRTYQRLKQAFYWHKMKRSVETYIEQCAICNKHKERGHAQQSLKFPRVIDHASEPLEKVHIDFLGPLPRTKNGNEHILVIIDQFTKWAECIPLPSQGAECTARAAVHEFFARFGYPIQLVSDQGSNFESVLFKEMCKILHIRKSRTTAYRPSANGQAERVNRTLMDAIRCFVSPKQDDWDESLPLIASALRSAVNRTTGFTPNKMMLGREASTPATIMFPGLKRERQTESEYVQNLQEELERAHSTARAKLRVELRREKRDHDIRANSYAFKEGQAVYILRKSKTKGKNTKLLPKWEGPGVITKARSPYIFDVKLKNSEEKTMHHDRLKKCTDANLPPWIRREQSSINKGSERLYCTCRKPDDGKTMVECETCQEWFHIQCLNMTKNQVKKMDSFNCNECEKRHIQ